jgi:hypothetical protein
MTFEEKTKGIEYYLPLDEWQTKIDKNKTNI